jgi:hypothetical protein
VLLLATGLSVPDDLLYLDTDGTVLLGEHGTGRIAKVGGASRLTRLPQAVPEAEGIAQIGSTIYVADQLNARVVALTATGVRPVFQMQPVPSGENLDGIASNGSLLIVPDSPHGTVLFVDPSGHLARRVSGFSRPAGAWVDAAQTSKPYLIADENAGAVFSLGETGGPTKLAGNLPGADDVARDSAGHVLVTLPALGRLRDVSSGRDIASGLVNPQGLGFDGAGNILVTESDRGRLDLIVKTFAVQVPAPSVRLAPGQGVCLGILRATGFSQPLTVEEIIGATFETQPGTAASVEVVPGPCAAGSTCMVTVILGSPSGREFAYFTYRD